MIQKTEIELAKASALKTVRTAIRLKYSLLADAELNEKLTQAEAEFDRMVARGKLPDPLTILKVVRDNA